MQKLMAQLNELSTFRTAFVCPWTRDGLNEEWHGCSYISYYSACYLHEMSPSAESEREDGSGGAQSQEASLARLEAVIRGWTSISFHAPRTALCAVTQCFPVLCIKADV